MKNLILALFCFISVSAFSQKVEITGQKDGLPTFKVVKDLYKDSQKVGVLQTEQGIEYNVYQKNKPNSKGQKSCFYISMRVKATKTQVVGQPYRKTCLCPN